MNRGGSVRRGDGAGDDTGSSAAFVSDAEDIDAAAERASAEAAGIPFNWMLAPHNDANTASIYEVDGVWRVSTTDDRATEESIEDYSDRGAAVDDFVSRVRSSVRTRELRTKLLGRGGSGMDRATARRIIAEERLARAVWFQRPAGKADVVAVHETESGFRVVSTDERGVEIGPREFSDESAALEMYILLLRDRKELAASGVIR
jgi:hypothetical protein